MAARGKSGALAAAALLALLAPGIVSLPAVAAPTAEPGSISVAVVVPITVDVPDGGLLDADTLSTLTSPTGALTARLDQVLSTSATIALDPMIVVSIRALGSAAPESARFWLERLESASNEIFLLAYGDVDLSAFVRHDALDFAHPADLSFMLDEGAFGPAVPATPTETPTPTPSSTPNGDPPPLPSTEELLAWSGAIGPIAWPAQATAIGDDLPAYREDGYEAVLLNSANLSETASAHVVVADVPVLVADSAASDLLREASATVDPAARQVAIARLGAALDGLAAAHPGRTVTLTIDRAGSRNLAGFAEVYASVQARASTVMTTLAQVLATNPDGARVVDAPTPEYIDTAARLFAAVRAEQTFSSIVDDPRALLGLRRFELLSLLPVRKVGQPDWSERADAFLEKSTQIVNSVTIVDGLPILVTSSSTTVPVVISNGLDYTVTVRVQARATRPLLTIEGGREVTIEPHSTKTVRLDAQAVTNGVVDVVFTVTNPTTGQQLGQSRVVEARLEAQWETFGLIGGAVIGLIFAVGIVRNIVLRRRKASRSKKASA